MINQKTLLEKLLLLRCRIEDWTHMHGWENMDNYREQKNKDGKIVYKISDWEYVDNVYNAAYNDWNVKYTKWQVVEWNKMWKKYKIDEPIKNYNLEPEWEQIQQMDWSDFDMDVSLGHDPAMGVKG
jgi:hypothetical protein|tara:strand:- start:833 stop:1210 length:378 start_codon:yes stop_codon:yes gene_type:complete